jgi:hypothetical protein
MMLMTHRLRPDLSAISLFQGDGWEDEERGRRGSAESLRLASVMTLSTMAEGRLIAVGVFLRPKAHYSGGNAERSL